MGRSEHDIQNRTRLAASQAGYVLWRNNVGKAWMGKILRNDQRNRIIVLETPRLVTFGLTPGASDLIGFKPTIITPEMVGQTVAIFTAFEIKTAKGAVRPEQENFLAVVKSHGAIAKIIRDPSEIP